MQELKAAEVELANIRSEIARLEAESVALNEEEDSFWRSRNAFSLSLEEFQNERDEVNIKYDHDAKLLERLQRTNVYNDVFCITHDGFFGVINGLRLGRLPNKQVCTI
jgi:beclin